MQILKAYCKDHHIAHEQDVALAEYATFQIGGNAPLLLHPASEEQIAAICKCTQEAGIPMLVIGKGSNILFSDAGYPGVVMHLGSEFSRMSCQNETTILCESGAALSRLCLFAYEQGLSGLEFAYGIPGSVGGAVYMNAGAYGGEISDVIVSASHITADGTPGTFRKEELELSYRHSIYSTMDAIITKAEFSLRPDDPALIKARMDDYMGRRRDKQPLEYPSAGSTFKRPEGAYASALIDQCGLKGLRVGGAQVSEKHAGFLINADHATAADVTALIAQVQQIVQEKTGFWLECEVRRIGF